MRHALADRASALTLMGVGHGASMGMAGHTLVPKSAPRLAKPVWPSPGATLDLDFVNNQGFAFGSGVEKATDFLEFTRADSGTAYNSAGVLTTYSANIPRLEFDPVSKLARGLLIEGTRTNAFTRTGDLANAASWQTGTNLGSYYTVTTDSLPAPDASTTTVAKFVANATTNPAFARQSVSTTAGTWTTSLFIYVPTQAGVTNWLMEADHQDTETGASPSQTGFDRWVRVQATVTVAATRTFVDLNIKVNGATPATGFTFYAWGAQLEAAAFAGSYISNGASATSRAVEIAKMTGGNFESWYSQRGGTLAVEWTSIQNNPVSAVRLIATFSNVNGLDAAYFTTGSGNPAQRRFDLFINSLAQAQVIMSSQPGNTTERLVVAFGVNDIQAYSLGTYATPDTAVLMPAVDRFFIGSGSSGTQHIWGYVRRIRYYPEIISRPNLALFG